MDPQSENAAQGNPWAQQIFAVTLFVEDLDAATRFYRQVFGLPVVFETGNSCVFQIGQTLINLLRITEANELVEPAAVASRASGSRMVFTIDVENVDAMCAALTARGVALLNGPMDRPWGIRTASFCDPGGHIWEIAQR